MATTASTTHQGHQGHQGRILVIDEERTSRQQLANLIGELGFEVDAPASAGAALKRVGDTTYDAVFLDLVLRRSGGMDLLEQVLRARPNLSVVIVTEQRGSGSGVSAMKKGAYHYLTKPVEQGVLDVVLRNCLERSRLLQQNAQLKQETLLDDQTTVFNRRYMDEHMDAELERSRRYGHKFSIVFLDLDHLRTVNDRYGHLAGSRVLREVAQLIQGKLRKSDRIFRYGGDEFLVTLPETGAEGALRVANRVRRAVRSNQFLGPEGPTISLTASFGVATFPQDGTTKEALIGCADAAMYQVKATTRDGVAAWDAR
jgi:diguanylate cyclase (GGDEF)-like protein